MAREHPLLHHLLWGVGFSGIVPVHAPQPRQATAKLRVAPLHGCVVHQGHGVRQRVPRLPQGQGKTPTSGRDVVQVTSVTIGVPVRDLAAAKRWYESLLQLEGADLEPAEGVAEYEIGGCWVQLREGHPGRAAGSGWALRLGVADLESERARLILLGVKMGPIRSHGVLSFCHFNDLDGNRLSLYCVRCMPA